MEINFYHDLRVLPDLALIELAAKCFKLIDNGIYEIEDYFKLISQELNSRDENFIDLAHKKSLDLDYHWNQNAIIDKLSNVKFSNSLEKYSDDYFNYNEKPSFAFIRVVGNSMIFSNIYENDILLVLITEEVNSGDIIVVNIENIQFVKRYEIRDDRKFLVSSNPDYPEFELTDQIKYKITGKVIKSIRKLYE
jgi:SOS-response transcriptional repressor LexA